MKSDLNHPKSLVPRRRWLGGVAAAVGGLLGWQGGSGVAARVAAAAEPVTSTAVAKRPSLAVHPARDSVKRHG